MSQTLEFTNPGGDLTLDESEIVAKDLEKVHSGVGDARVEVPQNDAIIPYVQRQDRVNYYVDGDAVFTGYAVGFAGNQRTGKWTLRLDGIGKRLEETRPDYDSLGGPLVYTQTGLDNAIDDYWDRTPFSASVTQQATNVVDQDVALESASTNAEWNNILAVPDSTPAAVRNSNLEVTNVCWTTEGEDYDRNNLTNDSANSEASDGMAEEMVASNSFIEWDFTPEHDIPADEVGIAFRDYIPDTTDVDFEWILNGDTVDVANLTDFPSISIDWRQVGDDGFYTSGGNTGYDGDDLEGGTTYTLRLQANGPTSGYFVDVVAPYDQRYAGDLTFDNTVDSNGYLSGPETKPVSVTVETNGAPSAYNITDGTITSTWDDTSNAQALALSNDSGANFTSQSNTDTLTVSFTTLGREAVTRFTLSRHGSRTTATPTTGFDGQDVQEYTLAVDLNDRVVIDRLELSRDHFSNLKTLHDYGNFLWVIEHDSGDLNTLTVSSFMRGQETRTSPAAFSDVENIQPEVAAENYFNSVYVEGALDNGSRPTAEVKDQDAISNDGREITPGVLRDQDISTDSGVTFRANSLLQSALENNELRGTISTYPTYTPAGYSYSVDFGQGSNEKTLESVSITESAGDIQATYEFVTREALSQTISDLKREGRTFGNQV